MKRLQRVLIPLSALVVALSAATTADAQSLADRVARSDGTVRFSFQPKPGVCGDGAATIYIRDADGRRRVQVRGNNWNYSTQHTDEWMPLCEDGPVRIALSVDDGNVSSLRTYVGSEWRATAGATDLGRVSAREAAQFLLSVAERPRGSVSHDAIFAATLADSADLVRPLLAIARNQNIPRDARKNAVFWLGQQAALAATAGLRELIDSQEEIQLREQAVFALSLRPNDESVPALIALIRRPNIDPRLKKTALFWLGQKDDPRALALFEEILIKG